MDFSETIAASDLKANKSRHLIKKMKICECQGNCLLLVQGRVHTKIQIGFSQKLLSGTRKLNSDDMTKTATTPIYGKNPL